MNFKCCKIKKNKNNLDKISKFLKIISDKNRLRILCILQEQQKKNICVCDIWQYLDLPQNLVSHHLKVLKDFGLVKSKKVGTSVIYSLNIKNIELYKDLLNKII